MHKVVTTAQMREIDRLTTEKFAIPSLQLMEQAAQSVTNAVVEQLGEVAGCNVLVICGPGHNGGDGAAIARQLFVKGAIVLAVVAADRSRSKGDARVNLEKMMQIAADHPSIDPNGPTNYELEIGSDHPGSIAVAECADGETWPRQAADFEPSSFAAVVDAMFGTGLTRPLTGLHESICNYVNRLRELPRAVRPLIVSVDIPSGLNSDSHVPIGPAILADLTVTFTAPKLANVMPPASRNGGELLIADIGSPASQIDAAESKLFLTEAGDVRAWLESTKYVPGSFKNSHGHALIIAGSRDYLGAPVLCGEAAMCSGAGLVTVATPASAMFGVAPRLLSEIITAALAETDGGAVALDARHQVEKLAERADMIAVGPGLTSADESTRSFMRWLVENRRCPLVIDADGLNALAPWPDDLKGTDEMPIVLTPHPGEMRRLLGPVAGDPVSKPWNVAAEFAVKHHLIVVLKGERTVVVDQVGNVFINPTGNPGVGTAGAGDTMTGVIAGFMAQDMATNRAPAAMQDPVRAAVYVCGMAADLAAQHIGMRTMTASDIRSHLSAAVCELSPETEFP